MRFSAITALCAAPLALAGSLQAELVARGAVGVEAAVSVEQSIGSVGSGESRKSNSNNRNGGNNFGQTTQITEIIVIWVNPGANAATTTINQQSTIAGVAPPGVAATHTVIVGGTAGLQFTPDEVTANVGDMVIFTFMSNNHTATQSAFTSPCVPLAGGMDSGFMANINNTVNPAPQMAMQVTVATPIWFFCGQKGHCGKGMTMAINPSQNKTQAMFKQMAIAQNGTALATAIIAGGPGATGAAAAPAPPAATDAAGLTSSVNSGTMVSGTGTVQVGGACECSCLCGQASFPNAAVQGVGAFGGIPGAMPLSALTS